MESATVKNYYGEIPSVHVHAANLAMLHISRPGASRERLTNPQPSVELVLDFPMVESIAGKYNVGFGRKSIDRIVSKTFLNVNFARDLS